MHTKHLILTATLAAMALWIDLPANSTAGEAEAAPANRPDAAAADEQYALAARHYHANRWQLAADEFQKFSERYANHVRSNKAHFFRGEALAQLDQFATAQQEFAVVLSSDPQGRYARQSLFRLAECALLAGDSTEAAARYAEFVAQYPEDELTPFALAYQADLSIAAKEFAAANKQYQGALDAGARGTLASDCQLGLARTMQLRGDDPAAAALYRKLADERVDAAAGDAASPTTAAEKALYFLADLQMSGGEYAPAERTLTDLASRYPHSELAEPARILRAAALRHLARFAEADELYNTIKLASPHYVEARFGLGLSQKAQEKYDLAAKTMLTGVPDKPHRLSAALHFEAGDALFLAKQYSAAAAQFDLVLQEWPHGDLADDALLGKLQVALAKNEHAQAIQLADELLQNFPNSELQADVRLTRATLLARQGDRSAAEEALQKLSADQGSSTSAAALATLATLQIQKRDVAAATRTLTELRTSDLHHVRLPLLCYQLAEAAYATDRFDVAVENFQLVVDDPQAGDLATKATSGLGWAQFQLQNYAAATASFAHFVDKFPTDKLASEAELLRGQSLEKLEQWDGALAIYHELVEKFPTSVELPTALWRAGRLHQRMQQTHEATAMLSTLAEKYPTAPHADAALYHWGWLEQDAGNPARAVELWQRVRNDYPHSRLWADATYRLAERAFADHNFPAATQLASDVLAAPASGELTSHARFLQARVAIAENQWDKVEQSLQPLVADSDSSLAPSARFWLAEAAYRQGKYEASLEQHTALIGDERASAEKWLTTAALRRAQALAQLGRWAESLAAAEPIAKTYPDFSEQYEVDYLIGRCLASQADFAGARAAYQKVLDSPAGSKTETAAMAQWMIGESYFHQENYPAALREYVRVESTFAFPKWQASALLQAGKCRELAFEWQEASGLYSRLLKNFPTSQSAAEAQRRLEIAQQRAKDNRRT